MKLLLDENLSFRLVALLNHDFPGSTQVKLENLEKSSDMALWLFARQHDFTLVTQDSDFHELSLLYEPPPKIIWLKCGNQSRVFIAELLIKHKQAIEQFINDTEASCLEIY